MNRFTTLLRRGLLVLAAMLALPTAALAAKPIVIGESDPEGCAACQGPQLGYRNGTMYSSYTAAAFARKHALAARHGVGFDVGEVERCGGLVDDVGGLGVDDAGLGVGEQPAGELVLF